MNRVRYARVLVLLGLLAGLVAAVGGAAAEPDNQAANAGWEEMGVGSASGRGISNNNGNSWHPSLAIGPDGAPVIVWYDESGGNEEIYLRRWNGVAWVELGGSASGGGISDTVGVSLNPSLAIDLDGMPVVAWNDYTSGDVEIYVRRWNGSSWVELGAGSASGGGISNNDGDSHNPSLVIGPDGAPAVAWEDNSSGNYEIYLRRWDGATWVELGAGSASGGGISNNDGGSSNPSLAIGPDGMPAVAWDSLSEDTITHHYTRLWKGVNWVGPDRNYEIYVRRWNGAAWVEIGAGSASSGGISDNNGESRYPSLAIGPDGVPVVAWDDNSAWAGDNRDNYKIHLRRWDGAFWADMAGSAVGSISNDIWSSGGASLAIGPDGLPVVAWTGRNTFDNTEIYVRSWDGAYWVEMSAGSASGGGISNTGETSWHSTLAIGPDGTPVVAWDERRNTTYQIYVRRYQPTCYALTLTRSGEGSMPTVRLPNSIGCPANHYAAGQDLTLNAAPTDGWRVKNWSGTENDSSTATINSLTMPAANHTVSVTYEPIPGMTVRAFTPVVLTMSPAVVDNSGVHPVGETPFNGGGIQLSLLESPFTLDAPDHAEPRRVEATRAAGDARVVRERNR